MATNLVEQAYSYKDIYVSLLAYLGSVTNLIKAKHNLDLDYINLDSFPDDAKLPDGDFMFFADWTIDVSSNRYGDRHEMMIGFCTSNDPNLMRLEAVYMNELMGQVARRKPKRVLIPIMREETNEQLGILHFADDYQTVGTRVSDARIFKSVAVTLLTPQRLMENHSSQ